MNNKSYQDEFAKQAYESVATPYLQSQLDKGFGEKTISMGQAGLAAKAGEKGKLAGEQIRSNRQAYLIDALNTAISGGDAAVARSINEQCSQL